MNSKNNHLEETKNWGSSNNVFIANMLLNKYKNRALDLGCGSLRNSKFLFNCGYIVDAIDRDEDVKRYTKFFDQRPKELFNLLIEDYTDYDFESNKYKIVVAQNTLSFNSEQKVLKVVKAIREALMKGGYFAGNLYGFKDYHMGSGEMSFYSKEKVEKLLAVVGSIHSLLEDEGVTKIGEKWHTHEFVVEKK